MLAHRQIDMLRYPNGDIKGYIKDNLVVIPSENGILGKEVYINGVCIPEETGNKICNEIIKVIDLDEKENEALREIKTEQTVFKESPSINEVMKALGIKEDKKEK